MNKLVLSLTQNDQGIKLQRAEALAEDIRVEATEQKNNLTRELNRLNNSLRSLTDLGPDNTYDLRPGGKNFDAKKWIAQVQDIKVSILNKTVELQVCSATFEEYFDEISEAGPAVNGVKA